MSHDPSEEPVQKRRSDPNVQRKYQRRLLEEYSAIEEEYHAAYPNRPMPLLLRLSLPFSAGMAADFCCGDS